MMLGGLAEGIEHRGGCVVVVAHGFWLVGKGVKSRGEALVRQVDDKGDGKREGRRVNRQHSSDIATRLTVNDDLKLPVPRLSWIIFSQKPFN